MHHEIREWQPTLLNNRVTRIEDGDTVTYGVEGMSNLKLVAKKGTVFEKHTHEDMKTHNEMHDHMDKGTFGVEYTYDDFKSRLNRLPKELVHYSRVPNNIVLILEANE